jgi:hypothetical protein
MKTSIIHRAGDWRPHAAKDSYCYPSVSHLTAPLPTAVTLLVDFFDFFADCLEVEVLFFFEFHVGGCDVC